MPYTVPNFNRDVQPELDKEALLRLAVARQRLLYTQGQATQGRIGPDLGALSRGQARQGAGLAHALGSVVGNQQIQATAEQILARQQFLRARAQESAAIQNAGYGIASGLASLGGQVGVGVKEAAQVKAPQGADLADPDVRNRLRLARLAAFNSSFGF